MRHSVAVNLIYITRRYVIVPEMRRLHWRVERFSARKYLVMGLEGERLAMIFARSGVNGAALKPLTGRTGRRLERWRVLLRE